MFFAVNVAHVQDIVPSDVIGGRPTCVISLDIELKNFKPAAFGAAEELNKLLRSCAKIGLQKVEVRIIGGRKNLQPAPLLLNQPGRIILVREMNHEEFAEPGSDFLTASELYMDDGKTRMMVERPGTFVMKVNAGSKVPML